MAARRTIMLSVALGLAMSVAGWVSAQQPTAPSIIKTVAKDSPGEQIGLRGATLVGNLGSGDVPLGGDILLSVEDIKAEAANLGKVRDLLTSRPSGSPFKVTVLRAGKLLELTGRVP